MNKDGTFNFSDLITKFAPTNAPAPPPKIPARPIGLYIGRLLITNATVSVTDLTHRQPFKRLVGPLNFTLDRFETSPDNRNPHSFTGTTDAGEKISWNGFFYLDPLRSWGEFTLENFPLNKYAPLYQDQVPFEIRDGLVGVDVNYRLELGATNRVIAVTNTSFTLRDFKLAQPGSATNMVELSRFAVTGVNVDAVSRQADVGLVSGDGGRFFLLRQRNESTNAAVAVVAPSAAAATNVPEGMPALLGSITNAAALLLNSTNLWTATVHDVEFTHYAFSLEDQANSRPARLDLADIALSVKNISNLPGTNLAVDLSLRWNTNGAIKTDGGRLVRTADRRHPVRPEPAGFWPVGSVSRTQIEPLHSGQRVWPPRPGSTAHPGGPVAGDHLLGRHLARWFSRRGRRPWVSDLLKWDSVRVTGIDANLNPMSVAIKEIALDNVTASVVIETNHVINLLSALHPPGAIAPADTNAPAITNETKVAAAAQTVRGAGTNAAPAAPCRRFPLATLSSPTLPPPSPTAPFSPNVNLAIQQFSGTIAGISSTEPRHADINLHAAVDGVGPIDIVGHINPFNQTATNDLKITFKDVDLTPTSPYAGKYAGYRHGRGEVEPGPGLLPGRTEAGIEKCHHPGPVHLRRKGGEPGRNASARAPGDRHPQGPQRPDSARCAG